MRGRGGKASQTRELVLFLLKEIQRLCKEIVETVDISDDAGSRSNERRV
jgi:predicted translin family RNA/ssDNA-binding protein